MKVDALKKALAGIGISESSLRAFRTTSRGDVLAFDGPGGEEAVDLWRRLRAESSETGYWPVMLGGGDDALVDQELDTGTVDEILKAAAEIDPITWFRNKRAEQLEDRGDQAASETSEDIGEWPEDAEPSGGYSTPYEILSKEPHASVTFALVPTRVPWEVPAFLGIGAWNECPGPEEHCAVMRLWHEQYGAEVVAVTRDVIEMAAARPPRDREAAIALAKDQYTYCADIVEQGCETIANLAAVMLFGTAWFFWWD
jgi:hypothetical protein